MTSYHGRTVLVTGASSGIGEAAARQLARDGARLLLSARSEDRLEALAQEFRDLGTEAHVFALDLAEPGAAESLYDRITAAGHEVDVLVNNAGFGKQGGFEDADAATYEQMVTLNVTNLVSLTRRFLPAMTRRGSGGVLNVASTAGFQPVPYFAVYAASKAFVLSFSQALHAEVESTGVAVTCLSPGPTSMGFFDRADMNGVPGGREAETPEKVARLGLEALLKNERSVISGTRNALTALATRFAPTKLVLDVGKRMMQGPTR
jgi:short-subunit dehydrogenase